LKISHHQSSLFFYYLRLNLQRESFFILFWWSLQRFLQRGGSFW